MTLWQHVSEPWNQEKPQRSNQKVSNVMAAGANRPVPQAEVVKMVINWIVSGSSFPHWFSTSEKRKLSFERCNHYRLLDSAPARLHRGHNSLDRWGNFGKQTTAPACKREKWSHTFDVLAGTIDGLHCHYRIRRKVVRTTAFSEFGGQNQSGSDQGPSEEPRTDYLDTDGGLK